MRINNPKLFNGDLLATKKQITSWLLEGLAGAGTETFTGKLSTSVIPISGITATDNVFPIYGSTIQLSPTDATTISGKFAAIEASINAVKKYEATKAADSAITVSTASATDGQGIVTDTFTVGLALDGDSLTQTSSGLKVTDGYVDGIASGIAQEIQLVKLSTATDANTAASYQVQFNGVVLGDTIDVPKDQFLSSVTFVEGSGSADDKLQFNFILADGSSSVVDVPLSGLFNEYTAGNGIDIKATAEGLEISGVVDPTSDEYFSLGANGFKVSGVKDDVDFLSGSIDYVSGVVSAVVEQVTATDKFVEVTGAIEEVSGDLNKVNDTLYYNSNGQTMIWDNGDWHNISMEALTTLTGTVNNTTTATSQAIKSYVDDASDALRADLDIVSGNLDTVSGDLDTLESTLDTTLPKKAEIFTVAKTFGGSTSATVTGRIIAVYDNNGAQVYPDITYANNVSTLSADDISTTETFTVVYVTATEQAGQ